MSLRAIPLLVIALLVYNLIIVLHLHATPEEMSAIFYGSGTLDTTTNKLVTHSADIFHLRLPNSVNGEEWHFTTGDLLLLMGFILMSVEIVKAAYVRGGALADQALATVLLIIFLVEFLLVPQAHTGLFFLFTLMSVFDVIVGAIIGIRTARRDIGFNGPPV